MNLVISLTVFWALAASASEAASFAEQLAALKAAGDEMLENLDVSYVYGGSKIGDSASCQVCNTCLEKERPTPKQRVSRCPACQSCSLDCSHFTQLVYTRAGLPYSYLTTSEMLTLSAPDLERRYGLVSINPNPRLAIAGDLLVYEGHVVIIESVHDQATADIIHATGGKDLKGPGQGIQRERFVKMASFRGELRRILRHKRVEALRHMEMRPQNRNADLDLSRLRPVEKVNRKSDADESQ